MPQSETNWPTRNSRKLRCRSAAKTVGGGTGESIREDGDGRRRRSRTETGARRPSPSSRPSPSVSVLPSLSPIPDLRLSITSCASPPTPSTTPSWPTRSISRGCSTSSATSCCRAGSPAARRRSGTTTCPTASARMDALRQAILQALMDSGQLTPDMLKVLRGESTGDAAQDKEIERQLGELLDKIVQRLIDEGYLNVSQAPAGAPGLPVDVRPRRPGALGGAAGAVQPDREGHRLPRLQDAQEPARQRRQVELRRARHALSRHRDRGRGREQAVRVRRRAQPRRPRDAHQRDRARGARRPAQPRVQRPDGAPERVPLERARRC